MNPKIPVSACCGAYVEEHALPIYGCFDGDGDRVVHPYYECLSCHKPCQIQETEWPFRMNTRERNKLNPTENLLIFNTDLQKSQGFKNGAWVTIQRGYEVFWPVLHETERRGESLVKASPPCRAVTTNQTTCSCDDCKKPDTPEKCSCRVDFCETEQCPEHSFYSRRAVDERIEAILDLVYALTLGTASLMQVPEFKEKIEDLRSKFLPKKP